MKKKRTTVYEKTRNKLLRQLNNLSKQGIYIDIPEIPKTYKQLKKQGVKNVSRETSRIKTMLKELPKQKAVSFETGEILGTVKQVKKEITKKKRQETRIRKQRDLQAERDFWMSDKNLPHEEEIVIGSALLTSGTELQYLQFKLSTDTPNKTEYGSKRRLENLQESDRARNYLLNLLKNAIERDGRKEVAQRLENSNADELLLHVLYDSNEGVIQSTSRELAEIINGDTLSFSDLVELENQNEADDYF